MTLDSIGELIKTSPLDLDTKSQVMDFVARAKNEKTLEAFLLLLADWKKTDEKATQTLREQIEGLLTSSDAQREGVERGWERTQAEVDRDLTTAERIEAIRQHIQNDL